MMDSQSKGMRVSDGTVKDGLKQLHVYQLVATERISINKNERVIVRTSAESKLADSKN